MVGRFADSERHFLISAATYGCQVKFTVSCFYLSVINGCGKLDRLFSSERTRHVFFAALTSRSLHPVIFAYANVVLRSYS